MLRVNVVFIASPTWTHEDIVVNSLNNNKHVYCEKPIAENIIDTKKCYETAKAKVPNVFTNVSILALKSLVFDRFASG